MINGIVRCVISSKRGYILSLPAEQRPGRDNAGANERLADTPLCDPTVLALWNGGINPVTGEHLVDSAGLPFANTSNEASVIDFGARLLRSGSPGLATEDNDYQFIERCIQSVIDDGSIYDTRITLRRYDITVDPSSLPYTPKEICYGPHQKWQGDLPPDAGALLGERTFMFGTGFSSTMCAETVQIAGNIVEQMALLTEDRNPRAQNLIRDEATGMPIIIVADRLGQFLKTSYMGYVHMRAAELRRPVFAVLCSTALIGEIERAATEANARNGKVENGTNYGGLLATINRISYGPEGESLRRLVDPYLVRYLN